MLSRRRCPALCTPGSSAAVVGLSKVHASQLGTYDYTGSSRFAWSMAYIAILAVAAYGVGLPDVPRTRRSAVHLRRRRGAWSGPWACRSSSSLVGDALLPRFVVFGSALLLVPWYLLTVNLALDGRSLDERRDRVVVVAEHGAGVGAELEAELDRGAEAGALIVATLEPPAAEVTGRGKRPLEALVAEVGATVLVLDRAAQDRPDRRGPGRGPARRRDPGPHPVAVLRGVAGQAAGDRAGAGVDDVRHRRGAPPALHPGEAGGRRGPRRRRDGGPVLAIAGRRSSATCSATGARCSTARPGWARTASSSRS